jgi:uncharacterized protein YecT (DUF1311 family)
VSLSIAPALAQDDTYTEVDAERLEACFSTAASGEQGAAAYGACIGAASTPCMDEPGGSSTLGMVTCMRREQSWWDEKLTGELDTWRESVTDETSVLLEAAQENWEAYLSNQCEFLYASGEGTIQQLVHASCMLDGTARRAIELIPGF